MRMEAGRAGPVAFGIAGAGQIYKCIRLSI